MAQGHVKFWNDTKGWGFVRDDDAAAEFFVHWSGIVGEKGRRNLIDGAAVTFDVIADPKDPTRFMASNVRAVAVEQPA